MKETLMRLGMCYEDRVYEDLERYMKMLDEKNRVMDLTNVPLEEMPLRHFADSLMPFCRGLIPASGSLADVGTGAGFPGLPAAIVYRDMKVTLIDAQRKRCDFLEEVKAELELDNVTVLHLRAEDAGKNAALREQFDTVCARAVAPLNVLAEYLLPLVRVGGRAVCWKGPGVKDEEESGRKAALMLGAGGLTVEDMRVEDMAHCAVVMKKTDKTPGRYPRKSGMPSKMPLGV